MTDHIDTAKEREWLHATLGHETGFLAQYVNKIDRLLDALDAERAMTKRVTKGWTQTVDKYHGMQARAEKAEAERDTAWNDAIEAAKGCIDDNHPFSIMDEMDLLKKGDSHE